MFILTFIKNKFFLVTVGLIVWLLFFDKNDLFTQMDLIQKRNKLKAERDYYIEEIKKNKHALLELETNKKSLEIFAREKYLMKKDNEDVYVIVKK